MSRHPELKWAQRSDKVFITVVLPDSKDAKVNLEPEGVFSFSATTGADNKTYDVKLELFDKVNVEASKINVGVRSIFCVVEKAEKGWWKRLLRGEGKPPHYLKVDWDKWVDEDEETGATGDTDLGGMDFSNFGGMGGGMGDLGGMMGGGMGGLGGMMGGGMGGLGGMMGGGMGDLGGMMGGGMGDFGGLGGGGGGGMGDFDDSDDEVAKPKDEATKGEAAEEHAEKKEVKESGSST